MTIDPKFRVELLNATPNPQTTIWWAMHQDYAEGFVFDEDPPAEDEAGRIIVKRLLAGERGHYGPLEHPQITFNVGWFPHSVMQQARTHRVGVSFDVQSGRYTGQRILDVAAGRRTVEEVFYIRPVGEYSDRQGKKYAYTEDQRKIDLARCYDAAAHYAHQIRQGLAEEHARGLIPFDVRQHFVVSFSLRALLHFLDLRAKLDAQEEIRHLCDLIWPHLQSWAPEVAEWYHRTRRGKARLAP
jgi:thymidylate synthase (FAD)